MSSNTAKIATNNTAKSSLPTDMSDWQALFDKWRASGLSQSVFCQQQGINYSRFVTWRSKYLRSEGRSRPQLATVKVKSSSHGIGASSPVKVTLPNGTGVYVPPGTSESLLAMVLKVVTTC